MDRYSEFKFNSTYHLAGDLRQLVFENAPEEYLLDFFALDPNLERQLLAPQKQTILHDFIEAKYNEGVEYFGDKMGHSEVINEWHQLLLDYKVLFSTQAEFSKAEGYEDDEIEYPYVSYLEKLIYSQVSSKVADETFQLLFSDRMFCLRFNSLIAETIKPLLVRDHPTLLEMDGKIKRCTYFPEWVQRAVFLRDRGCCAVCLTDLSGLLKTDYHDAIDHIVPLNLGGSNDVTNFQLICRSCNLKKLGHTIRTSEYYPKYF
ncbi:MAG: HNH endonuclease [Bacteroidetes bacterium]|nr:HNH endonuclease [Bacteroidota bacterium]